MDPITIRLQNETFARIESEAEQRDLSKSEVIREWFTNHDELQREHVQLQSECDELQAKCDRLRNEYEEQIEELERETERTHREKRLVVEQPEEHTEFVNTVKEERSLAKRKANAGVLTRAKWWLVGMGVRSRQTFRALLKPSCCRAIC
jgi:Ribbon-helix-helix protein, copG family